MRMYHEDKVQESVKIFLRYTRAVIRCSMSLNVLYYIHIVSELLEMVSLF
jgi:hypothetical protein